MRYFALALFVAFVALGFVDATKTTSSSPTHHNFVQTNEPQPVKPKPSKAPITAEPILAKPNPDVPLEKVQDKAPPELPALIKDLLLSADPKQIPKYEKLVPTPRVSDNLPTKPTLPVLKDPNIQGDLDMKKLLDARKNVRFRFDPMGDTKEPEQDPEEPIAEKKPELQKPLGEKLPQDTALITLKGLHQDAEITINGMMFPAKGDTRSFKSPDLAPGRQYFYDIRMTPPGGPTYVRRIQIEGGKTTVTDFSK